jgi:parallel beta-helix repeat protein
MRRQTVHVTLPICTAVIIAGSWLANAGDLNPPPGPVGPTMKTLDQVEPRIPLVGQGRAAALTITAPGSYYLTGNLNGVAGQNGIEITANDVTLDLSGYALIGVPGSLDGILVTGVFENIAIVNGTAREWGGDGVDASSATNGSVERLRVTGNGGIGVWIGPNSTVVHCIARLNGDDGVSLGQGSVVSHCVAQGNQGEGIQAAQNNVVVECTVADNGDGIFAGSNTIVRSCTVATNNDDGITAGDRCHIVANTCFGNGEQTAHGAGIWVTGSDNRIEGNNVMDNDRGLDVDGTGNFIVKNSASGNAINYDIASPAQALGEIVVSVGPLSITICNPWANFEY